MLSLFVAPKFFGPAFLLLVGSTLAKLLDVQQQRREARDQAIEERRRGLDETRRLLYMIRLSPGGASPELVATITNALVHHHRRSIPDSKLAGRLLQCGMVATDEDRTWVEGLIAEITKEIDAIRG